MKTGLKSLLAAVAFTMMMPFQAFASEENTVINLNAEGNKAGVQITLPENTGKGVNALELRINVSNLADANVGFEFSDINATVQETRYRQDSGELIVYVAGGKQLFANDTAFLGYVVADSNVEGNVVLDVKENALQVADGIYGIVNNTVEPTKAELKTEGASAPVEPDSSSSNQPDSTPSSSQPDNSSSNPPVNPPSSQPNPASSGNNNTNGGTAGATGNTTVSNNKKPTTSNKDKEQDVVEDEEVEESSKSSSTASESKSSSTSAADSSSSKSESVQSTAQKEAGNFTIWMVVAVLAVVAVVAVAVIVVRKKK